MHVKRDRDDDTGRCAVRSWYERVRKAWEKSPMSFFFRASFHVVCEGRLYGFRPPIALHGVKNAGRVRCTDWKRRFLLHSVEAGNRSLDEDAFVRSEGHVFECLTEEGRFLSKSLWRTLLRGSRHALWWVRASPPIAPTVQTAKRGTVWPFGRLEHWWLGSAPKLGCDGAVTTHK